MFKFENAAQKAWPVIFLLGILLVLSGCSKGETGTVTAGTSDPEFSFEAEQTKEENTPTITAGIEIPGYDVLYIDYGSTTMEGDFYNPDGNNVYFRMSFWLSDGDEAFYQSDLISPGQHLYRLEMDETFDLGTYDMCIVYETFSADGDYTPRNGATVNCLLVVE